MKEETFEAKLAHANRVLEQLMDTEITLEESVKLYEAGLGSIKEAQQLIDEAKVKITTIEQGEQRLQEPSDG